MKKAGFISIFLVSIFVLVTAAYSLKAVPKNFRPLKKLKYVNNQIIVTFKPGVKSSQKKSALTKISLFNKRLGKSAKPDIRLVYLNPAFSVKKAIKLLSKKGVIKYAEPNYARKFYYAPNDPYYTAGKLWGLSNINAPDAWNLGETEGWLNNSVTVAVIDSGIDLNHLDLVNQVWHNTGEIGSGKETNKLDDDSNGYVDDWQGVKWAALGNYPQDPPSEAYWLFQKNKQQSYAQAIKGADSNISVISLPIAGFSISNIKVSIRTSLDGPDLAYGLIKPKQLAFSNSQGIDETLSLSAPVFLSSSQTYYLVIEPANTSFNYFLLVLLGADKYDLYTDGNLWVKKKGAWSEQANSDIYFLTDATNNDPQDSVGHGTHVSGIIGAQHNNGTGVAGVDPGANIMPLNVDNSFDNNTIYDSSVIQALEYAADNGAKVANMSFGGQYYSRALGDAVNYAYNKGVVLVAAVGNDYGDKIVNYPAGYQHVLGVGAIGIDNKIANFSTTGRALDVVAPGVYIYSTMWNDRYEYDSGTSMASPYASGLAALLVAKHPSWSAGQVISKIEQTTVDLGKSGRDDSFGFGKIDALNALGESDFSRFTLSTNRLITFGQKIKLRGRLLASGWPPSTPMANQKVTLYAFFIGGSRLKTGGGYSNYQIGTTTTDANGNFSFKVKPIQNTIYQVVWAGNSSYQKASRDFLVKVRQVVTIGSSKRDVSLGEKVTVSGKVSPALKIANPIIYSGKVGDISVKEIYEDAKIENEEVRLQRSLDGRHFQTIKKMILGKGYKYSFDFQPFQGRYYYRVITQKNEHYVISRSVNVAVTAH